MGRGVCASGGVFGTVVVVDLGVDVEEVSGDLFAQRDVDALAHGVNCAGVMGAGIAVPFRARFPDMYETYRQQCRSGQLTLGGILPWRTPSQRWVYNLATQPRPGRCARLDAVASAVRSMLTHAGEHAVTSVALPRIGCGYGGLDWDRQVRPTLVEIAGEFPTVRMRLVSAPSGR